MTASPELATSPNLTVGDAEQIERFVERLRSGLAADRPTRAAHARFAHALSYGRNRGPAPWDVRQSAVLVLFYPHAGVWHVPLLVRPADMKSHAGQVALPGGKFEGREDDQQCAVREAEEEVGVAASELELVGRLTPVYIYPSNFIVHPCVAVARVPPIFRPNPSEVAQILEMPVACLWDESRLGRDVIRRQGVEFSAPCFFFEQRRIWGATSLMLSELQAVLSLSCVA